MKASNFKLFMICLFTMSVFSKKIATLEVIYALNAGGESFTDSNGIRYRRDYLTEGTASDYGKALDIKRVQGQDKILYQTERYSTESFGYSVPMPQGDGDYVLWLKFSEVWFNAPNLKVFDVALNDDIVVKDLDIFERVGRGVAHDEIIPFQVRQNKLIVNGKASQFNNEVRVEFVKTDRDNPKVNAILIVKGTIDQIPQLPPYSRLEENNDSFEDDEKERKLSDNDDDEQNQEEMSERIKRAQQQQKRLMEEQEEQEQSSKSSSRKSKTYLQNSDPTVPPVVDPYASDETSYIIPILVTIGAFIPLLFCLCKL